MYLLIGDPHLTDRPRDGHRFGLFKWIRKQQEKHRPRATIILGDMCDRKDKHSALLVNRIVDELSKLDETHVLMGNHDYIDPNNPFFRFLSHLENITFITKPLEHDRMILLPHIREEAAFKEACKGFKPRADIVLLHNTFEGAVAESGAHLGGFSTAPVAALRARLGAFAGDVHRPQRSGPITYVGVPYSVRFGDDFDPRCLLVSSDGTKRDLYFDCPRKWSLTIKDAADILKNKDLLPGDQVKVTVELPRAEIVEWKTIRRNILAACEKRELDVFGIDMNVLGDTSQKQVRIEKAVLKSPAEIMAAYGKAERLSQPVLDAGAKILKVLHASSQ